MRTNTIKNEIDEIEKQENEIKRNYLKYETNKYIFDFQQFETVRSFGDNIYTGKISIDAAQMDQSNFLENMAQCDNKTRQNKKNVTKKRKYF